MTINNSKPILYSTPMVQALLENRKNQTRRICKISPLAKLIGLYTKRRLWDSTVEECPNPLGHFAKFDLNGVEIEVQSKFTEGDILWVRETFFEYHCEFIFKSDYEPDFYRNIKWKPSIFMPRKAARIFLKVTNVRVERLQDISEEDAIAEGVASAFPASDMKFAKDLDWVIPRPFLHHQFSFLILWQKINGKKHPWKSNPWVWVYEFERIEKPVNFLP